MLSPYSTPEEIASETTRLQAERVQIAQQARIRRGESILLAFWRQHPDVILNEANERIVREFIGTRDFSIEMLNGWLPEFESRLVKVQQETPAYVPPAPQPEVLVPFTRRELLRMESSSLRELINRSSDHSNEVNRILNARETK